MVNRLKALGMQGTVSTQVRSTTLKLLLSGSNASTGPIGSFSYYTNRREFIHFDCDLGATHDDRIAPQGIIVFDELDNYARVYRCLSREYKNIPIVLCGNQPQLSPLELENGIHLPYFEVSARNNDSPDEPLLYLAKKLTGNNELLFVDHQKPKRRWVRVMKSVLKAIACGFHLYEVCDAVGDIC